MKSGANQRLPLCCFVICVSSALTQTKKERSLIMFKRLCVLTDVDLDPSLAPHLTVISVGALDLSPSPRGDGLDAPSFSIKAPENKSCSTKHLSLLLSACFQTQLQAITGNTPSSVSERSESGLGLRRVDVWGRTTGRAISA